MVHDGKLGSDYLFKLYVTVNFNDMTAEVSKEQLIICSML